MPGTVKALRMHSGWILTASPGWRCWYWSPYYKWRNLCPFKWHLWRNKTRVRMQRTELGLSTKLACLMHSPTKVTRVLRFAILARGVGMEEEAGEIREGLFCPAWTWASEKQGTIRKFYGKDMCFQKTLLLAERRMDWRKQNGITPMFPSCFVGLSGLKSRILFFGLFRLNLYVPIMIRKAFNTKSNPRGCTKSTSLATPHCAVLSRSVVSNSLRPYELYPTRLLCPWDSPGKNTEVGCHALFQGIFPT